MSFVYYSKQTGEYSRNHDEFLHRQYEGSFMTDSLQVVKHSSAKTVFVDCAEQDYSIHTLLDTFVPHDIDQTMSQKKHFVVGAQEQFIDSHLRELMQGGFFAAYNNPLTITKIEDILSWSELDYNSATGTIYAICGTKSVGKSEAIHHVMQYVPGTEMIPKYSTRKPRSDDAILSDTRPLQGSSIETDFKDHINWQSYGNRCAISRREIDAVLEIGNDVFLAIGQVEGLESVLSYYPDNTVYFVIERDPARIASALKERSKKEKRELDVPFESVVSVQNEFIDSFHFAKIENYSFFNVARTMENFIARRRSH